MPTNSLPNSKVQEILRLIAQDKTDAEVAQSLSLSRMQVAAIVAHARIASENPTEAKPHPPPSIPPESIEKPKARSAGLASASTSKQADRKEEMPPGFFLGEDSEFETPITWDPGDSSRVSNPHLMIMGESGSGKTYAAQGLIAEIAQQQIPSIVFDYGQSFELESLDAVFRDNIQAVEYLIGEEGLAFNPLEIFSKDVKGPNQVATRLADVFDAGFQLGDIQKKVLIDAAIKVYRDSGITQDQPKTWTNKPPTIDALQTAIEDLATDKAYPNN
jgi:hypothetical protein